MARATSSLPVPVSPVIRTLESVGATLEMRESTFFKAAEVPTISSNIASLSISARNAMFFLEALLGLFEFVDIRPRGVPSRDAPVFVRHGAHSIVEPAILSVSALQPHFV